jgi:hypothetical protein
MLDCCMVVCNQQVAELQCDVQSLELKRDSQLQELRSAQEQLRQLHTDNGTMLREQRTAKVTFQCYTIHIESTVSTGVLPSCYAVVQCA